MRRQGYYIQGERLKFKKGLQKRFIFEIKNGSRKSWVEISNILKVHPETVSRDWYSEKNTLPEVEAKKMYKICPFIDFSIIMRDWVMEQLPPRWGQRKGGNGGNNLKKIQIPPKCPELAEILGSALGDGSLSRYVFTLSCDATQRMYTLYIERLIWKVFRIKCKIFLNPSNKNNIFLRVYSAELVRYFQKQGLSVGNKIRCKARLPMWVFSNKKFASAALRGLFDTDGGIYQKQKNYKRAIIEFQTKSPHIHRNIFNLLKILEFKPSKGNNGLNLRLQNQEEVFRFFKIVGSSNPKNIIRYQEFLKKGCVPSYKEVAFLIRGFKGNLPFKVT